MSQKQKILVIDDSVKSVEFLEGFLFEVGFDVLKAYNGKEAIETVKKDRPDLILLDIMMPEMDGLQVCETLRKDSDISSTPIIMVTAVDKDHDIVTSLERGADDYIVKPVILKELLNKVNDLLSKAKTGQLPSQQYFKKLNAG